MKQHIDYYISYYNYNVMRSYNDFLKNVKHLKLNNLLYIRKEKILALNGDLNSNRNLNQFKEDLKLIDTIFNDNFYVLNLLSNYNQLYFHEFTYKILLNLMKNGKI